MTDHEIRVMIRKVSKRRHRETKHLAHCLTIYEKSHPYISQSRTRIERYGRELTELLGKL